jgi:curli biogenesis system outer membrane secretion channel CsgG
MMEEVTQRGRIAMKIGLRLTASALTVAVLLSGARADGRKEEKAPQSSPLPAGTRIAVVVMNSNGGSQVDRVVGDMLTTALRKAGVRVVERQELDALLKEQQLARSGVLDPQTAVPAGKVLGADYMLGVKATEFGVKDDRIGGAIALGPVAGLQVRTSTARVVLDARLLDVKTAEVLTACTSEGKQVTHGGTIIGGTINHGINLGGIDIGSKEWAESSLGKAARKAVNDLVKKLTGSLNPGEGTVLAVLPGGEVIVGLGSFDGVRAGDRLDVTRLETMRDSKGNVVWTDERAVGQLRITEVRADRAKALPVESGVTFQEGDRVKARPSEKPDYRRWN